ncbi:hypothetical protein [Chitinophaga ginsengisoli]|uniref:Uncharacterized protein n=1 Tax=Chitinophaga ginsengisoli TaxID=363837 RepID=A0A2P8FYX6_9BACT|nr:hypothetical protein [Chitinophaga ginsengisoli]PSL26916.1 hypothetical protein CLV42_11069 [Chitinophaga ginsengisoli]
MKPYILLITLLFSGFGVTKAQQRTRDKLFPSFQQDFSALQQKESKDAPKDHRTTREQLFTDYHPQHTTRQGSATRLKTNSASAGKNPSDVTAEESTKALKARQVNLPAPATPPTQGNESESSRALKTAAPVVTPKATAPTAAPVNKSFERKKQ